MVLIHLKRLPSTVSVGWCVSVDEWVPIFVLSTPEASNFCYIVGGRVLGVVDIHAMYEGTVNGDQICI